MNFKDKTAVVTGGGSGIGKATALAFAEAGANVLILDINEKAAQAVVNQHSNIKFALVDVSDALMVASVAAKIGAVDILVSNAGIEFNNDGSVLTMSSNKLHRILDVNLWGAVHCARAFVPEMPKGGKVVMVSSLQAFMACHPGTSYQASKAALIGLGQALAIEVARKGINVNVVCPGGVATEGMGAVRAGDSGIDDFRRNCPLGRRATPDEIAKPIMFLCSEWASYITGSAMIVDGGHSAMGMPYAGPVVRVEGDPDA